jgi:hypothetical protein
MWELIKKEAKNYRTERNVMSFLPFFGVEAEISLSSELHFLLEFSHVS